MIEDNIKGFKIDEVEPLNEKKHFSNLFNNAYAVIAVLDAQWYEKKLWNKHSIYLYMLLLSLELFLKSQLAYNASISQTLYRQKQLNHNINKLVDILKEESNMFQNHKALYNILQEFNDQKLNNYHHLRYGFRSDEKNLIIPNINALKWGKLYHELFQAIDKGKKHAENKSG